MDEQKPDACPVGGSEADLSSGFDMFDADYNANPGPIWKEMRETCPFSRTEERGGFWVTPTY
ncbi:MAG: hypothetical protein HN608_19550, partial [Rhodospirillaceae bacterium]|nr:hypothetical protein [Rhodospirillaceae bacterium]